MKRHEMVWIPNLLTGLNLFFGFWSIIMMIEGHYLTACWFIMIASICDGLDGKLARLIHTSSEFGVEMDSLCDVVSFGLAPSILLWTISFNKFGFLGVVLSSFPLIFGMIRLARYNLTATTGEKKPFYQGLPIPMQANILATFVIFNYALWPELKPELKLEIALIPLALFLAFLMVSHVPYEAMPKLGFHDAWRKPWKLVIILGIIAVIAFKSRQVFFPLLFLYVLRGVIIAVFKLAPVVEEEELDTEEVKIKH